MSYQERGNNNVFVYSGTKEKTVGQATKFITMICNSTRHHKTRRLEMKFNNENNLKE